MELLPWVERKRWTKFSWWWSWVNKIVSYSKPLTYWRGIWVLGGSDEMRVLPVQEDIHVYVYYMYIPVYVHVCKYTMPQMVSPPRIHVHSVTCKHPVIKITDEFRWIYGGGGGQSHMTFEDIHVMTISPEPSQALEIQLMQSAQFCPMAGCSDKLPIKTIRAWYVHQYVFSTKRDPSHPGPWVPYNSDNFHPAPQKKKKSRFGRSDSDTHRRNSVSQLKNPRHTSILDEWFAVTQSNCLNAALTCEIFSR